MQQQQERKYVQ